MSSNLSLLLNGPLFSSSPSCSTPEAGLRAPAIGAPTLPVPARSPGHSEPPLAALSHLHSLACRCQLQHTQYWLPISSPSPKTWGDHSPLFLLPQTLSLTPSPWSMPQPSFPSPLPSLSCIHLPFFPRAPPLKRLVFLYKSPCIPTAGLAAAPPRLLCTQQTQEHNNCCLSSRCFLPVMALAFSLTQPAILTMCMDLHFWTRKLRLRDSACIPAQRDRGSTGQMTGKQR